MQYSYDDGTNSHLQDTAAQARAQSQAQAVPAGVAAGGAAAAAEGAEVHVEQLHSDKVGRNDPCPCGSGKKYKKCCGV